MLAVLTFGPAGRGLEGDWSNYTNQSAHARAPVGVATAIRPMDPPAHADFKGFFPFRCEMLHHKSRTGNRKKLLFG